MINNFHCFIILGLPVTEYRSLMAAVDRPITPAVIELKDAYRDPIKFRYSAMKSPIQPVKKIDVLKSNYDKSIIKSIGNIT